LVGARLVRAGRIRVRIGRRPGWQRRPSVGVSGWYRVLSHGSRFIGCGLVMVSKGTRRSKPENEERGPGNLPEPRSCVVKGQRAPMTSLTAVRTSLPALRIPKLAMISSTPSTMSQMPTTRVSVPSDENG